MFFANCSGRTHAKRKGRSPRSTNACCGKVIKGRMVHNGKPTRDWLTKEDMSSPMAGLDSSFFTSVVDAKEKHNTVIVD